MLIRKSSFIILTIFVFLLIGSMANAQQTVANKKDTTVPVSPTVRDTSLHVAVDTTIKHYHQLPKDSLMNPNTPKKDTFFLAKKKGLLGKLGHSIATETPIENVVQTANPYLKYAGKTIVSIEFLSLGFDRSINDTTLLKRDFGERIAEKFHRTTRSRVIEHNLLFKEGDKVYPFLLADNERLLRSLPYLNDARILVITDPESKGGVDVIVITKDVFSIVVSTIDVSSASVQGIQRGKLIARDENIFGTGARLQGGVGYDETSKDQYGFLGELLRRNIRGSFINWDLYYNNFNGTFNGSGNEETYVYSNFEKPLASEYMHWTGAADFSYRSNLKSLYQAYDSLFDTLYKYNYYDADAWYGYNIGSRKFLYKNVEARYHKFIAIRGIDKQFVTLPDSIYANHFQYVSTKAAIGELSVFRQNLYKTNFIYGFGITEDVPEGFSASLIGGYTDQVGRDMEQHIHERKAPYLGFSNEITTFSKKKSYYDITAKIGGIADHNFEDLGLLLNVFHFTRLRKITPTWFDRCFFTAGFAKQINADTLLTQPLYLQNQYGLPYYNYSSGIPYGQARTTLRGEADFYNNVKHLGFKFAPFVFADLTAITPFGEDYGRSDLYSAFGIGLRTRNENLIFGTITLQLYYFPPVFLLDGTSEGRPPGVDWNRIDVSSNNVFRYNSTFIGKPDFVFDN